MAFTQFVVHHTAGPENQTVNEIRDYHVNVNGWDDIGYNWLIANDNGKIYEGRGWGVVGAHTLNYNSISIGVAVIGTFDNKTISNAAKESLAELFDNAVSRYSGMQHTPFGHRDFNATSCPGDEFYDDLKVNLKPGRWENNGENIMATDQFIGLEIGDKGEMVKGFQAAHHYAGFSLGKWGVDGVYGPKTAQAHYEARKSVGSDAEPDWGENCTGWGSAQLLVALIRKQANKA